MGSAHRMDSSQTRQPGLGLGHRSRPMRWLELLVPAATAHEGGPPSARWGVGDASVVWARGWGASEAV